MGNIDVERTQNSLFSMGTVINCFVPPNSQISGFCLPFHSFTKIFFGTVQGGQAAMRLALC